MNEFDKVVQGLINCGMEEDAANKRAAEIVASTQASAKPEASHFSPEEKYSEGGLVDDSVPEDTPEVD